jgi:hypothetical protein
VVVVAVGLFEAPVIALLHHLHPTAAAAHRHPSVYVLLALVGALVVVLGAYIAVILRMQRRGVRWVQPQPILALDRRSRRWKTRTALKVRSRS